MSGMVGMPGHGGPPEGGQQGGSLFSDSLFALRNGTGSAYTDSPQHTPDVPPQPMPALNGISGMAFDVRSLSAAPLDGISGSGGAALGPNAHTLLPQPLPPNKPPTGESLTNSALLGVGSSGAASNGYQTLFAPGLQGGSAWPDRKPAMEARATQSQAFGAAHARLDGESDLSGGQDSTQLDEALRIAHASVNYIASNGPGGICSIGMTGPLLNKQPAAPGSAMQYPMRTSAPNMSTAFGNGTLEPGLSRTSPMNNSMAHLQCPKTTYACWPK
uniref:Uncharacterized protein n=1 Tax=Eutreptiella gymnastica TaxID=73025 RepID=A0A7S4LBM8_9EUGL